MKKVIFPLLLMISCGSSKPVINVVPPPKPPVVVIPPIEKPLVITPPVEPIVFDTIHNTTVLLDTVTVPNTGTISVKDFGAAGTGGVDDYPAIQYAIDYLIAHPTAATSLRFPVGTYFISRPLMAQYVINGMWQFFHIKLTGDAPAKEAPDAYLSKIVCGFTNGFALGIQFGRGIIIENLAFQGKYTFPNQINNSNIGTTLYSSWSDGSVEDGRNDPYAAIDVDPFCDSNAIPATNCYRGMRSLYLPNTGRGGTSGLEIRQCAIHNFMVGVILSPNGYTQNAEMINFIDDDIDAVKVAIAVCQDQSKEIHIDRLKVWASTYTVVGGADYGQGIGGSIMIEGMNIAGNVNQLFDLQIGRFPLSAKDIYSESLFRIGSVGGSAGANFINFQIDFLTGAGMPAADYLVRGYVCFYGGMLRYYDSQYDHRLNFTTCSGDGAGGRGIMFRDMILNNPPLIRGLYGIPTNGYASPRFENVHGYYTDLKTDFDSLAEIPIYALYVDRVNWTGVYIGAGIGKIAQVGDYILGEPTNHSGIYYDKPGGYCNTKQVGRVRSIVSDTLYLDDIGLNVFNDSQWGRFFIDKYK